jgi:DNA polymerase V
LRVRDTRVEVEQKTGRGWAMTIAFTPVRVAPSAPLSLPVHGCVHCGFASPADDYLLGRIDLNAELIRHPQSTFLLRVRGDSMRDHGIFDHDVVVVDRALVPRPGHIVIAVIDNEFTCKQFARDTTGAHLRAGNPDYPDIVPSSGQTLEIWGVVTATIKQFPR